MIVRNKSVIDGIHQKPILIDTTYLASKVKQPIIIFCHGYKGFKDWGAWNLMANAFAKAGFYFIKFNFSHNGGTIERPIDFPDLEAFSQNNYSKELDDLESTIDWVYKSPEINKVANINNITLLGHSRGGGIVSIKANEDVRIKNLVSLAGVSDFKSRFPKGHAFGKWKQDGVMFVINGRTNQNMPHYFQFYEDFIKNETRLTIKLAVSNLKIPHLIIHGNEDSTVLLDDAKTLHSWNPNSTLEIIQGANHVFGGQHPWEQNYLPEHLEIAVNKTIVFLKRHSI